MSRSLRALLIFPLLAGCFLHEPLRAGAVAVIRFPFTLTKSLIVTVLTSPRLPSLARDKERLTADLVQERVETARLREQLQQAERATALLAAHPVAGGLTAHVIGRSTVPTQHTLLLDRGRRHGVAEESLILDLHGVVGRVTELGEDTALVLLLTDPDSRVAGVVERSREVGLLIGRGGGLCELIYLDVEADIEAGDRIVTAGLGGLLPGGLPLGTVTRVARDEQSWAARALVKPAAAFRRLEDVLCLPAPARSASQSEAAGAQAGLLPRER